MNAPRLLSTALLAVSVLAARGAAAQPVCSGNLHYIQWPSTNPLWKMCWMRPSQSSGQSGSGIELRDVYYRDHLVLKRAHAPILNVLYAPGGCGCYRDWSNSEVRFRSDNEVFPGYSEPTTTPTTVCDWGGSKGDQGAFTGVAAEKTSDVLVLTSQYQAGWYRYTMKWYFYGNGKFQPFFGFAAVNASCIAHTHTHHVYWRLDFDIDGPANDAVEEALDSPPGGPLIPIRGYSTEATRVHRQGMSWTIKDSQTGRGFHLVPGAERALPPDTFAVSDIWLLRYRSTEIDDAGQSGPACAIKFNNFLNSEPLDDLVMWYRAGAVHEGGELDDCHVVGPTFEPLGDWTTAVAPARATAK
jgi:hypothetical protein